MKLSLQSNSGPIKPKQVVGVVPGMLIRQDASSHLKIKKNGHALEMENKWDA
jgi:hypothetical protein